MTMTPDAPPIPAAIMSDQPFTDDDFSALDWLGDPADVLAAEPEQLASLAAAELKARPDGTQPPPVSELLAGLDRVRRFEVGDDRSAEWAMRRLAEQKARTDEVRELAQAWRDDVDRWERDQLRGPARFAAFLEGHLHAYMADLRAESDGKVKSRPLPSGTIKSTGSAPKVGITDEEALIAWADENLEGDDLELVAPTVRKALVSELRKVAEVSTERLGDKIRVTLDCGHGLELFRPEGETEPSTPLLAEDEHGADVFTCGACPQEFGEHPQRDVVEVVTEPVTRPVVRDKDTGDIVPGADVLPETVTFSVKVGG